MSSRRGRTTSPKSEQSEQLPSAALAPPDIPEWLEEVRVAVETKTPLMRTLIVRSINAVMHFVALSEAAAVNATIAPTDLGVLVRALASNEVLDDLKLVEPLAPAFIRGIDARNRLLNENGGTYSADQVADILGITRQAVEKRRSAGNLLAVTTGRHGYRYPAWQFTKSGVLPGLESVLKALVCHDAWMQAAFFVSKNPRLDDRTPIELLGTGELSEVLKAAEAYGEHGAA